VWWPSPPSCPAVEHASHRRSDQHGPAPVPKLVARRGHHANDADLHLPDFRHVRPPQPLRRSQASRTLCLVRTWLLLVAIAALAVYLLAPHDLYKTWITNNPDSDPGIADYDGLLATLYVATFTLFTQAFLALAMLEYFPEREAAPVIVGD
jgi:hypothetical protein